MVFGLMAMVAAQAQEVLPVERVRFYETGVAYFERSGRVAESTALPVPRSHLDDALKTLVVLGADAEVGAIRFPSSTSERAARVLAGFSSGSEQLPFEASLRAMQGFEVAVEVAGESEPRVGLLMDVSGPLERVKGDKGDPTVALAPEFALTQLLSDGTVMRATTSEVEAIRPRGAELARRLEQAVLSTGSGRARQGRELTVDLWESGPLTLGYLAETPIWRVSYRAVLGQSGADLQAWALIHNDTDEDWEGVRVELANGQPDSFLYPMATPRYAERELVTPEVDLSPVPQLATDTPDAMWDDGMAVSGSSYGSGYGGGFGARGSGGVAVRQGAPMVMGRATAQLREAEAVQTPTQFVYKVAHPLDLPAQHSALVPIVSAQIDAEAVVAFTPDDAARNGVWLTNQTARTLPAGVLSVFEAGGLSGESGLNRMKPEQHQMVLFGTELDVELERRTERGESALSELTWTGEQLRVVEKTPREHRFGLTNRSGRERAVWVALELTVEDRLEGIEREELDPDRRWTWVPMTADPGESESVARVVREQARNRAPEGVEAWEWRHWAEAGVVDARVLQLAADVAEDLAEVREEREGLVTERDIRKAELERLREDLRAAGESGSAALARRVAGVEQDIRRLEAALEKARGRERAEIERLHSVLDGLPSPEREVAAR